MRTRTYPSPPNILYLRISRHVLEESYGGKRRRLSVVHRHVLVWHVHKWLEFTPLERQDSEAAHCRYNKAISEGTLHKMLPSKDQPQNGMAISNPERCVACSFNFHLVLPGASAHPRLLTDKLPQMAVWSCRVAKYVHASLTSSYRYDERSRWRKCQNSMHG